MKIFHQRRLKFDTFKHWKKRVRVANLTEDYWKNSVYTCLKFQKKSICMRVIGLAAPENLYKIPENAKTDLIGTKWKVA